MDIRVFFTCPDGCCNVMHVVCDPKKGSCPKLEGETDEAFALRIAQRDAPEGSTNFRVAHKDKVPLDRTFRNCWEQDLSDSPDEVKVHMGKARQVHLNRLRQHRNEKLAELDQKMMRAIEDNDTAEITRLKRRKQKLRDMPALAELDIEAIHTPEELKAFIPTELQEENITEIRPHAGDRNPNA